MLFADATNLLVEFLDLLFDCCLVFAEFLLGECPCGGEGQVSTSVPLDSCNSEVCRRFLCSQVHVNCFSHLKYISLFILCIHIPVDDDSTFRSLWGAGFLLWFRFLCHCCPGVSTFCLLTLCGGGSCCWSCCLCGGWFSRCWSWGFLSPALLGESRLGLLSVCLLSSLECLNLLFHAHGSLFKACILVADCCACCQDGVHGGRHVSHVSLHSL